MTWTDLLPIPGKGAGPRQGGVMMSCTKPGARYQSYNYVTIRPHLFEGGPAPAWLKKGGQVNVQVGLGDDRGHIRIVRGKAYAFGSIPRDDKAIRLAVPLLPGQKEGKQVAIACEFEFHDDWVSITLPPWAKSPGAIPQPLLSPEAAARKAKMEGTAA